MDSEISLPPPTNDHYLASTILADETQRRLLSILQERPGPLTVRDLTIELAARERGASPSAVTDADRQRFQVLAHHTYLPKLDAIGWVDRRPEGIVVAEQPSTEGGDIPLPSIQDPENEVWDAVAAVIERPYRRHVVSILVDRRQPTTLEELATDLANREGTTYPTGGGSPEDDLQVPLHHVDLPKLDAVGLVDYDSDEKTIAGGPLLSEVRGLLDLGY